MSEQTQNNQQMVVIALAVVAVLLAALVGVLIYQQAQTAKLAALSATTVAPTGANAMGSGGSSAVQPPAGMTANTGATTPFDVKTATKVPAGMEPAAMLKTYNEDVIAGKYDAAYAMLPLDKKTSYGSASAYGTQLKAYGITSYKVGTPTGSGDTLVIAAEQVTPQMPITYTWNFKKVSGQWYVESRVMGGTVQ
jgi:hypothetical protein